MLSCSVAVSPVCPSHPARHQTYIDHDRNPPTHCTHVFICIYVYTSVKHRSIAHIHCCAYTTHAMRLESEGPRETKLGGRDEALRGDRKRETTDCSWTLHLHSAHLRHATFACTHTHIYIYIDICIQSSHSHTDMYTNIRHTQIHI